LIALACLVFLAGTLAAELFLTRISLLLLLAGFSWTFWGLPRTRVLLLPLLLLATAIPLPAIIYNALAGPVQVLLSRISSALAQMLGLYLYSDGTSINVPNLSFPVGEMCAGLRALPSLWAVALFLFASRRVGPRLIALAVVSCFTLAAILGRVLGTAALADRNLDLARAFYQLTSPWAVFLSGVILLWTMLWLAFRGERTA
jgi:exosortase